MARRAHGCQDDVIHDGDEVVFDSPGQVANAIIDQIGSSEARVNLVPAVYRGLR